MPTANCDTEYTCLRIGLWHSMCMSLLRTEMADIEMEYENNGFLGKV